MKKKSFIIFLLILTLSGCFGSGSSSDTSNEIGKVKIVNSWGKGYWEKVSDGCFYVTYEALKKGKVDMLFMKPKERYRAKIMAIFKISATNRSSVKVKIGIENSTKYKVYENYAGTLSFPDNNIAIDITEIIPINNERVYIEINSGEVKYFAVEEVNESGECKIKYETDSTAANSNRKKYVTPVKLNEAEYEDKINGITRKFNEEDIKEYLKNSIKYKNIKQESGTGLRHISEEKLREMIEQDKIKVIDSIKAVKSLNKKEIEKKVDYTESIYFPPIGNQFKKGACTTWSVGYYTATFYTAKANEWSFSEIKEKVYPDIPEIYKDKIASPEFLYNQANSGGDNGSYIEEVMELATNVGVCSLKTMPYSENDYTKWPSETAWREAPKFRSSKENNFYYLKIKTNEDIEAMKILLSEGYLSTIAIDQSITSNSDETDTVYSNRYSTNKLDHAVTVAGYDDEIEKEEE